MKNKLLLSILAIVFCGVTASFGQQPVSDEVQRHMVRAQVAEEMAKSTGEYSSAIKEYQQAIHLEPNWPDPYYRLGLLQEKSGELKKAIESFNAYLRLAPNAQNAAKIKEQIYSLEYKLEQILTVPEIIDVLVSNFVYSPEWVYSATAKTDGRECKRMFGELGFNRDGINRVKVLNIMEYYPVKVWNQPLTVENPILTYYTMVNVCGTLNGKPECTSVVKHEVEVVSKKFIKVKQQVQRGGDGAGAATGDEYSCTFRKK
jgi:hypothetical protein